CFRGRGCSRGLRRTPIQPEPLSAKHEWSILLARFTYPDTMKKLSLPALLFGIIIAAPVAAQQSLNSLVDREIAQLVSTYKMLHAAPELSHHEEKTSAFFATQLRALGFTVTERV